MLLLDATNFIAITHFLAYTYTPKYPYHVNMFHRSMHEMKYPDLFSSIFLQRKHLLML